MRDRLTKLVVSGWLATGTLMFALSIFPEFPACALRWMFAATLILMLISLLSLIW